MQRMEFRICSTVPINLIKPSSSGEEAMLESNLLKTKLNYSISPVMIKPHGIIQDNDSFSYRVYDGIPGIGVPNFTQDLRRSAYYLRMMLDANAVHAGFLPLHASAISEGRKTKIIFGETGKGKSLTLSRIVEDNPGAVPIGDDHIIVGEGIIGGNSVMRNRYGDEESYLQLDGARTKSFEEYEILIMDVTGKNSSRELTPRKLIKDSAIEAAALKYLISEPMETGPGEIHKKLTSKTLDIYKKRFNYFVNGATRIRELSGDREYLEGELKK